MPFQAQKMRDEGPQLDLKEKIFIDKYHGKGHIALLISCPVSSIFKAKETPNKASQVQYNVKCGQRAPECLATEDTEPCMALQSCFLFVSLWVQDFLFFTLYRHCAHVKEQD